jgi:chromosome segregation protein
MQARRSSEGNKNEPDKLDGIIGLVAEMIEPAPGYETAVEAVLGETLQYVLVESQQSGLDAISFLKNKSAGRSGFIPFSQIKPLCGSEVSSVDESHRLLNHITVKDKYHPIAKALLGHVAVVDTIDQALELYNRNGRIQTIVTQQGDVVAHQGLLIGGSKEQLAGILAKRQELRTLEDMCKQLEQELVAAQERQQVLEQTVRKLEVELQQNISGKSQAAEEANEIEKALYRLGEDLKNTSRHQEIIELEQEQLLGEESDLDDELDKFNQTLSRISIEVKEAQEKTATTSSEITQTSSQLDIYNQKIVDLKLELAALQTKLENGSLTLTRLREFEHDSHQRLEQLSHEIIHKNEKCSHAKSSLTKGEANLQQMYDSLKNLDVELSSNETEYNSIDSHLKETDEKLAAIQSDREKTMEKIRLVELDLTEKRIKRDNIAAKAQERYNRTMQALKNDLSHEEHPTQMSVEEIEKELKRFRSIVDNIGDVNLGAIEEYEEHKKRFDFLSAQRDDLIKAIDDLHKVIRKINRITQERFMQTFEQVNQKLSEVFPKLFEGGAARLELSEPGKPLETGVEFFVHPPGKKLTRMSLLSGGEKALSAIAFIFAIFLIRPASFCLLDEIDAPLDEANVVRFNDLMQVIGEKSQIIMITHNKKSMEFADILFGVTMEQKGISKVVSVNLQGREN